MFKVPTPGGITRWVIADMLLNAKTWNVEVCDAVTKTATGLTLRVCGDDGTVVCATEADPAGIRMIPGPFRRWRLKNAVRRLAAARISKVLP